MIMPDGYPKVEHIMILKSNGLKPLLLDPLENDSVARIYDTKLSAV